MAVDKCEPAVIRAFEKEGWHLVARPYTLFIPEEYGFIFIDLELQRDDQTIAIVEVKCFTTRTFLSEFYHAIGQYVFYRNCLHYQNIHKDLYLSIPAHIHQTEFSRVAIQHTLLDVKLNLVVIDIYTEVITQWLPSTTS
jgi:hypothetical protein